METFKVTRIFSDENGESIFEEIFYPLKTGGPMASLSERIRVKDLAIRNVSRNYEDFQNTPEKQYVVLLDTGMEIKTTLHGRRLFGAGDVLLLDDVKGRGHRSRNTCIGDHTSLFITFETKVAFKVNEGCM